MTTFPSRSISRNWSHGSAHSHGAPPSAHPVVFECGDLLVDPARRIASRGGRLLTLSPKEFAVLECLLSSDGRVVSSEELLDRVWDDTVDPFTTTVKTTILRLRNKLGQPAVIETVREGGYRIGVQTEPSNSSSNPSPHPRLRASKRTLQLRLAATYGGIFFLLGLVILAIPYFAGRGSLIGSVHLSGRVDASSRRAIVIAQRGVDHHQQLVLSLLALMVLGTASAALGWLLAGRTLRPLREITARTREISATNLHRRLAIAGPYEELNELGETLDDLLARLEASFASQRNFVSNASHELRTPLTAERALLQVALADTHPSVESLQTVCEALVDLGGQQERLIDDLLTLAQSEGGIESPERFDLSAVAHAAVRTRLEETSARGVKVEAVCVPGPVFGDRRLVSILVGNLVDNAIRHNVAGGNVTVRTSHSGRGSIVAVSNSGPVVAEGDVAHLCEPFMRPGNRRRSNGEGYGLGLAIVQSVARAHRAELRVRARSQGGLAVDVTFPQHREPS